MNEVLEQPLSKLDHLVARDGEGVKAAAVPRVGRGLARVVFSSLLVTIVLAAIPYGTVEPWWVAVFECLVFVLGLLALVQMFAGKSRPAGGNLSLLAPLMFLVLFVVLQSLPLFSGTGTSGISFRESLS